MKRIISMLSALCLFITITGCSSQTAFSNGSSTAGNISSEGGSSSVYSEQTTAHPTYSEQLTVQSVEQSSTNSEQPRQSLPQSSASMPVTSSQPQSSLTAGISSVIIENPQEKTKILIAYFTWAENTHVDDPSTVDVDATTSASVLLPGNVGLMAQWIAEETGGDTFSIITREQYSSDYDECLDRAIDEHDRDIRPVISEHVDNIGDYDVIFLGFPNWWYSCPMAILTFINEHDLSGKTIIPFCSHGTGGFAASLRDIGNELPKSCTVLKEFGAYRPDVKNSKSGLLDWLESLDIEY